VIKLISVLIRAWGPVDAAPGSYDWITVGRINNPESLDIDYLNGRIMKLVKKSEYRPHTDVIRLEVTVNDKIEMKMTLLDFFKNQKEVK